MIYFSIYFYTFYCAILSIKKKCANFHLQKILIFISLVLIAGLRFRLAPDSVAYANNLEYLHPDLLELFQSGLGNTRYSIGWVFLNSLFKSFGGIILFQIFTSIIINGAFFWLFSRCRNSFFIALFLYESSIYLYFNTEIIREALAVSIFIFSVSLWLDGRKILSFIVLPAMILFHQFSFLLLFFPILVIFLKSLYFRIFYFILLLLSPFFINQLIINISSIKMLANLEVEQYLLVSEISILGILYYCFLAIPSLIVATSSKTNFIKNSVASFLNHPLFFSAAVASISILYLRITSVPFADRIFNYFAPFNLLFAASILLAICNQFKYKISKFIILIISLVSASIFFIYPLMSINKDNGYPQYFRYYPYASYLDNELIPEREDIITQELKEILPDD